MHKVGEFFKNIFKKFFSWIKFRWSYFVGLFFTWVIPIYLLNEIIALTEEVSPGIRLTFAGCIVSLVVFFAFKKAIYRKICSLSHGLLRGVLLTLYKALGYALIFGALMGIGYFAYKLLDWWKYSGVSILIGALFYVYDEKRLGDKSKGDLSEKDNI